MTIEKSRGITRNYLSNIEHLVKYKLNKLKFYLIYLIISVVTRTYLRLKVIRRNILHP